MNAQAESSSVLRGATRAVPSGTSLGSQTITDEPVAGDSARQQRLWLPRFA